MAAFEASGVRVDVDPVKGKVVYAEQSFKPGQVIFREQAFVYGTWSSTVCEECDEVADDDAHPCASKRSPPFPKQLMNDAKKRTSVLQTMRKMDGIEELDRARCIVRCLAKFEEDATALDEVLELTCANRERCAKTAKKLRSQAPEIFPKGFTNEQMATLIGALNTNSHELENLGGSGLFLSACRMEHNCQPNCSFTTYDSELWMVAIKPVQKGDALSIDYGNFFYRPTEERMNTLLDSYGFICTCDACMVEPDTCRAFKCPADKCTDGRVWPYPRKPAVALEDPSELEFDWKCTDCGHACTDEQVETFEAEEHTLLEGGFPQSLEEMDELLKASALHETHYLLFWALDAIGCEAAALSAFHTDAERHALADTWQRIIKCMNIVVPTAHHEKTIYYDNLAQVYVILGKIDEAREAYTRAYEISCLVSGEDCVPTQNIKELVDNTPRNADQLRAAYASRMAAEADEYDDEDDDDEEDEDDELDAIDEESDEEDED
ncbi:TPA: hypothetical protein N0F65_011144 [Lagenidium giganteum]|uniref:SET domain-containing protein n=1 Tax=Lagenidium giganteum TaxID=4803 RepID=A0AAV2Z5X0_9STRA|nr:TPA: hypothetical protein N0F65_011144 [Lagenidium giganteum]